MRGRRPYSSILIDLFNAAGAALRRAGLPLVQLDEQELLDTAFQETGLRDFGDGSFHEPLWVFLKAYETEAKLTLIGRLAVRRNTLQLLTNRLWLVEDRKRYPAIAQQDIRQPLFIVRLPRTGSTLLHNLLAQDPGNRVPLCWEAMFPSPPRRGPPMLMTRVLPRPKSYSTDLTDSHHTLKSSIRRARARRWSVWPS
jgi:Sulfotransferase family